MRDARLVERAGRGDKRAFAAIFKRHSQGLYRYCLTILGSPDDAQDALQSTMEKALRALPGDEREIDLKPWLYRIAHNESIELIRRRRGGESLDAEATADGPGLAATAESRERLRRLIADLGDLPERQRGALVMREMGGLDFNEIGEALETSPAVARQTLYEARVALRRAEEGREMPCEEVTRALSGGDGRIARRRDIRAHLRTCANCRRFKEEIAQRSSDFAALSPLPGIAAAGILQGLLGGSGGSGSGGLAVAAGGGAAKSLGASAAIKAGAAVVAVAAVGTVAADRGGLIDTGLPGSDSGRGGAVEREATEATGSSGPGVRGSAPTPDRAREQRVDDGSAIDRPAVSPGSEPVAGRDAESGANSGGETAIGREGDLPEAASHSQETAAAHKQAGNAKGKSNGQGSGKQGKGTANGKKTPGSHPSHPAKPDHPSHPVKPPQATAPATEGGGAKPATPPGKDKQDAKAEEEAAE
jgi:RNA polymerase sigma factor (sigma-70 family)